MLFWLGSQNPDSDLNHFDLGFALSCMVGRNPHYEAADDAA
jgi:hypothetical protein